MLTADEDRDAAVAGIARGERVGRNVLYRLQDHHVAHIVRDALLHVRENDPS